MCPGRNKVRRTHVDNHFEDDEREHGDFLHTDDADAVVIYVGDAANPC